jgi:hypothetical protein
MNVTESTTLLRLEKMSRPTRSKSVSLNSSLQKRPLFLTVFGLFLVLGISALPTVFYYWDFFSTKSGIKKDGCNSSNVERVREKDLLQSPCAESFFWTANMSDSMRNISVFKCNFQDVNKLLCSLSNMLKDDRALDKCLYHAKPLICHVMFQDCESTTERPSFKQCVETRDHYCKQWWNAAEKSAADVGDSCVVFPKCSDFFDSEGTTNTDLHLLPSAASRGLPTSCICLCFVCQFKFLACL